MPHGQLRKGFFFYFGMFVLLLATIFLVCLVIMIFSPGKAVLWMKYFTDNKTYIIEKTTDESSAEFKWSDIDNLKIVCPSYANVVVENNNDNNLSKSAVYVVNNAKGFQGADGAVDFAIDVVKTGTSVTITLSEPNGFLFFSKDIRVIIHTSSLSNDRTFEGLNLVVEGGDGDIEIGGTTAKAAKEVKLSSLYAETKSGTIMFTEKFDASALNTNISYGVEKTLETPLYLQTGSGKIMSARKVSYSFSGKTYENSGLILPTSCNNAEFRTDKGQVNINALVANGNNVNLACKNGSVVTRYIRANNVAVTCTHGNYNLGVVDGNLNFNKSEDRIIAPNIMASQVTGDFTLSGSESDEVKPDIDIGTVYGVVDVKSNGGSLNINLAHGAVTVLSQNDMKVAVVLAEQNLNAVSIINNNAEIRLGIRGNAQNRIDLKNNSGRTFINVTNIASFTATTYGYNAGEFTRGDIAPDSRINIVGFSNVQEKNPFKALSGNGTMEIWSNSNVDITLVAKDSFGN